MQDKLKELRKPFEAHLISKLPKPTKAQTTAVKQDFRAGIRCGVCGGWHHKDVIHLDYVGHAALTDRLLDIDPEWNWEPAAKTEAGIPMFDNGGLWIRLTVCGVTRLGYGSADGKSGGDAVKEIIGDALRNAAMRFGCALDLWHKGDLHVEPEPAPLPHPNSKEAKANKQKLREAHPVVPVIAGYLADESQHDLAREALAEIKTEEEKMAIWNLFTSNEKAIIKSLGVL